MIVNTIRRVTTSSLEEEVYPIVSTAATTTSGSPTAGTAPYAVDRRKRDKVARGAARGGGGGGGDAGASRPATQRHGDQHGQCGKLAGKAAGMLLNFVFTEGGVVARGSSSVSAGRPAAGNALRPGVRVGRCGGAGCSGADTSFVWQGNSSYASPDGLGRLWMSRTRLLLLRWGGHVVRRGRRMRGARLAGYRHGEGGGTSHHMTFIRRELCAPMVERNGDASWRCCAKWRGRQGCCPRI
jgi:hypothetical protein